MEGSKMTMFLFNRIALVFAFSLISTLGFAQNQLNGRWRTPYFTNNDGSRTQLELNGTSSTFTLHIRNILFNPDSNTQMIYEIHRLYSYQIGSQVSEAGVQFLDQEFRDESIIPRSQEVADLFNQQMKCGLNNWQINIEQMVTGRACYGNRTPVYPGDRLYNIIQFQGTTQFKWGYFPPNNQSVGSDYTQRPTQLDSQQIFYRI